MPRSSTPTPPPSPPPPPTFCPNPHLLCSAPRSTRADQAAIRSATPAALLPHLRRHRAGRRRFCSFSTTSRPMFLLRPPTPAPPLASRRSVFASSCRPPRELFGPHFILSTFLSGQLRLVPRLWSNAVYLQEAGSFGAWWQVQIILRGTQGNHPLLGPRDAVIWSFDPGTERVKSHDDIPKEITDPDATKPEDWDEEEDGEWAAPTIPNPYYKGPWIQKL